MTPIHKWAPDGKVLILKSVEPDGTSHGGFKWPESGPVESPNWSPEPTCNSGGLFGWPWGVGIGNGKYPITPARWIVFAADPDDIVVIDRKVKAPRGEVIYSGDFAGAIKTLLPGLDAWYAAHTRPTKRRESRKPQLMPPVIARGDDIACSPIENESIAIAERIAVGHTAVTRDKYGRAIATHGLASSAVAYEACGLAIGGDIATSLGPDSVALSMVAGATVNAAGTGSIACAFGETACVESGHGSICLLMCRYGRWRPRPGSVLIQHWKDDKGVWHTHTWHADDYRRYCGKLLNVDRGSLFVVETQQPVRAITNNKRKKKENKKG